MANNDECLPLDIKKWIDKQIEVATQEVTTSLLNGQVTRASYYQGRLSALVGLTNKYDVKGFPTPPKKEVGNVESTQC